MPPTWVPSFTRTTHRTSGSGPLTLLVIIVDTNAQLDEEVQRVRCERLPRAGACRGKGMPLFQHVDVFATPESPPTPWFRGSVEVLFCRHDGFNHWPVVTDLHLPPLCPPWRWGSRAESCKPLIIWLPFLLTGSHPEAS